MHRLWAIYPEFLELITQPGALAPLGIQTMPRTGMRRSPAVEARVGGQVNESIVTTGADGVATITVAGVLTKAFDSWLAWIGETQTTYAQVIQAAHAALNDPAVTGVKMVIDSPGGDVDGHEAAMEALSKLAAAKPLVVEAGMCCSAAAWLSFAAAKGNVAMASDGLGGSVGVIVTAHDMSARYAQAGIKPVVIASGENKAFFGTAGLPIEAKHIDNIRATLIDPAFAKFKAAAVAARGIAADAALFDGRVLTPDAAVAAGLVDFAGTSSEVSAWAGKRLSELIKSKNPAPGTNPGPKDKTMKATLEQLRAAFGDAAFCLAQLDAGATMEQAYAAWNAKRDAELKAANDARAKAEADLAAANAATAAAKAEAEKNKSDGQKPGTTGHTAPLQTGEPNGGGNADAKGTIETFLARVAKHEETCAKAVAWSKASKEDPAGLSAYLANGRKSLGLKSK